MYRVQQPSEYECMFCDDKQEIIDTCKFAAQELFTQLYLSESANVEMVDWCMNELVSYLNAVDEWPKDSSGNYLKAKNSITRKVT